MSTSQTSDRYERMMVRLCDTFPIGCRVLHKIDGCEGNVTAHQERDEADPRAKYRHPVVVQWEEDRDSTPEFRAEFSSYRAAELLRV